jgi:hypothetical protein
MFLYWQGYRRLWLWVFYPVKHIKIIVKDLYPVLWVLMFHPVELAKKAWDKNCWNLFKFSKPVIFPDDCYQGKYIAELAHEFFYKWG